MFEHCLSHSILQRIVVVVFFHFIYHFYFGSFMSFVHIKKQEFAYFSDLESSCETKCHLQKKEL
jgi:hypothetical protein